MNALNGIGETVVHIQLLNLEMLVRHRTILPTSIGLWGVSGMNENEAGFWTS